MPDNSTSANLTPNFNTRNSGDAYKKLNESLQTSPDAGKLRTDEALGTLDDHVDITDPDYNEGETKDIERQLAREDGVEPLPEDPVLEDKKTSYAIENPSDPNPF